MIDVNSYFILEVFHFLFDLCNLVFYMLLHQGALAEDVVLDGLDVAAEFAVLLFVLDVGGEDEVFMWIELVHVLVGNHGFNVHFASLDIFVELFLLEGAHI